VIETLPDSDAHAPTAVNDRGYIRCLPLLTTERLAGLRLPSHGAIGKTEFFAARARHTPKPLA
jgi:hypothetical protein